MGFSRQEYWSGLLCPPPGDLPHSGIEPMTLTSPALAGWFFTVAPCGKPLTRPTPLSAPEHWTGQKVRSVLCKKK